MDTESRPESELTTDTIEELPAVGGRYCGKHVRVVGDVRFVRVEDELYESGILLSKHGNVVRALRRTRTDRRHIYRRDSLRGKRVLLHDRIEAA